MDQVRRMRASVRALVLGAEMDGALSESAVSVPVPVREIFRRFWPYARPYRPWLAVTLLFILLTPAVETATIWLFKQLVDDVLVPRTFGPFIWIAATYVALTLASGAISFLDDYLSAWIGERFLLAMRTDFFRHLQGLSPDFFERHPLGDVLSRLTGDIGSIETFVLSGVASTLSYALRILFFGGALFVLQWRLALVSLLVTPLFWLAARSFSRLIKQVSREQRRLSGTITSIAEESLASVPLVQAYNGQRAAVGRFHQQNLRRFAAQMAATRLRGLFSPIVDLIDLGGVIVVLGMGTWELSHGSLSLGGLLVFLAYLNKLYSPIRGLTRLANSIHAASASAERVIELLDRQPLVADRPGAVQLARARGRLVADDVSFRYPGSSANALQAVSFHVEPGQAIALVGPSGAGKSTMAKLLLRFYDPTAGHILLDGYDLCDVTLESLREQVAVVLQETLVFDGTIRENIAFGRPGATEAEIEAAARLADVHEFIASLPEGYDTSVGQKGRRLSGGQRQRIAIARAMVRDAPLLLLDEPTTGLDGETGWRILGPLRRLMDGRTTIVISHNLLTVRDADEILVLDQGRIVERGRHDDLLGAGGTYARRYHAFAAEGIADAASGPHGESGSVPQGVAA